MTDTPGSEKGGKGYLVICAAAGSAIMFWGCLFWWVCIVWKQMNPRPTIGPPTPHTKAFLQVMETHVTEAGATPAEGLGLALFVSLITLIAFGIPVMRGDTLYRKIEALHQEIRNPFASELRLAQWIRGCLERSFIAHLLWLGPPVAFFLVVIQRGHPDAAVFAMALAAIYVAGVHYAALERQERLMDTTVDNLRQNVTSIANALGNSQAKSEMYHRYANPRKSTLSIPTYTYHPFSPWFVSIFRKRSLLAGTARSFSRAEDRNSASAADGVLDVFDTIDRGIYAIYRRFDIDHVWWSCDTWKLYREQSDTLYRALVDGRRKNILFVAPITFVDPKRLTDAAAAEQFVNFMGLVWYCVVLWLVRAELGKTETERDKPSQATHMDHRIAIADTSLWIHVVDGDVHQIIDQPGNELAVRNLSLNVGHREVPLAAWARREINEVATRGPSAEEFICSTLCRFHQDLIVSTGNIQVILSSILNSLGIDKWLSRFQSSDQREKESHCKELLSSFAHIIEASKTGDAIKEIDRNFDGICRYIAIEVQ